jgi:hypothetical protein
LNQCTAMHNDGVHVSQRERTIHVKGPRVRLTPNHESRESPMQPNLGTRRHPLSIGLLAFVLEGSWGKPRPTTVTIHDQEFYQRVSKLQDDYRKLTFSFLKALGSANAYRMFGCQECYSLSRSGCASCKSDESSTQSCYYVGMVW